jgi:ferritin-like metal-binding protein YciE
MTARDKTARGTGKDSPDAKELLVLELQEIHSAETQLSRALPRLSKSVDSDKLRDMLGARQEEGARILEDVESALEALEESPGRKKNIAAEGLIGDAREHVQEIERGPALDAVLIGALQKTDHYCIAAWGTAKSLAIAVDNKVTAKAMERAIKEGTSVDQKLTELAETEVTPALMDDEAGDEGAQNGGQSPKSARSGRSANA